MRISTTFALLAGLAFGAGACGTSPSSAASVAEDVSTANLARAPQSEQPSNNQQCGGIAGLTCAEGDFCDFPNGHCGAGDQMGTCRTPPDMCTMNYDPVCGCDGKTYSNACAAAGKSQSVRHDGECGELPQVKQCGGAAGATCDAGEFCQYDKGSCGHGDAQGVCAPRPEICTKEWAPVCGCDGVTYGNACMATGAGQSTLHDGECAAPPGRKVCGGLAGVLCDGASQFCEFEDGICGRGDQTGLCDEKPEVCTEQYDPVCGCNGKTYSNRCAAHGDGQSVLHVGPCPEKKFACGSATCDVGHEVCVKRAGVFACEPAPVSCKPGVTNCGCVRRDATYSSCKCRGKRSAVSVLCP